MVTITFPNRDTEKRALAFLLGRFSGRVLRSGEHLVPEAVLEALADQNIPFTVKGKATYEQQVAVIRGSASSPVLMTGERFRPTGSPIRYWRLWIISGQPATKLRRWKGTGGTAE